jgi:hypothetical protein
MKGWGRGGKEKRVRRVYVICRPAGQDSTRAFQPGQPSLVDFSNRATRKYICSVRSVIGIGKEKMFVPTRTIRSVDTVLCLLSCAQGLLSTRY